MPKPLRVPLLGALLLLLAAALVVSLLPAGLALDDRIERELRRVAVEDLGRAPMILKDRNQARAEALAMHAASVAGTAGLLDAVKGGRLDRASALARETAGTYGEDPVLISPSGEVVVGPALAPGVLDALRRGEPRIEYVYANDLPRAVGLVALGGPDAWLGAAGSESALGEELATTLSGLARSDVSVLAPGGGLVSTTMDSTLALRLGSAVRAGDGVPAGDSVVEVSLGADAYWVATGDLGGAGTVLFSRSVAGELAALPGVRRSALLAGLLALGLALGVGAMVALALVRPVRALGIAADRVSAGDFDAPVPSSRIGELDRLGAAFDSMRASLRMRLDELAEMNAELEERQKRLSGLQAELIRQDRLASSGRMAAELAHEIRNPVANLRNCLEVVRRGLDPASEGARFADLAIDELLRMHELAEHLLDLNRPADPSEGTCRPAVVAGQVADLASVGEDGIRVRSGGPEALVAALPPDALKQILFNLVENSREATEGRGSVDIEVGEAPGLVWVEVGDDGPGLSAEVLPRLFDPFFTTKGAVHGVGLGLFIAEGLVRRYGGRIEARNRPGGRGAVFRLEIPRSQGGEEGA